VTIGVLLWLFPFASFMRDLITLLSFYFVVYLTNLRCRQSTAIVLFELALLSALLFVVLCRVHLKLLVHLVVISLDKTENIIHIATFSIGSVKKVHCNTQETNKELRAPQLTPCVG
jgi:hypothetical protein